MSTAVVTGAASGIGRELARLLAGEGHVVHLADISPTEDLANEIGGVAVPIDVSDARQMTRLAHQVPDLSVLCLNAGILGPTLGNPWQVPEEEWDRLFRVNVLGVVNGLRAFVPALVDSGEGARIIITASLAGLLTFPGGGAYAATKHAVVAVAEQAAMDLRDTAVSVTLLCPALVRTAMSDVGADPADVAAEAIAAAQAGRFLVSPPEWYTAFRASTDELLAGRIPSVPAPDESTAPESRP